MGKNKEPMETEAQKGVEAATEKAPTRPVEAAGEDKPQSGTDAEEREDTEMDPGSEAQATGGKGTPEMMEAARKVFAVHDVDRLWFTADGLGFGKETDAEDHASMLENKSIITIDRQ
jgi:hypothetical protein